MDDSKFYVELLTWKSIEQEQKNNVHPTAV
jgi:hypothetical protein